MSECTGCPDFVCKLCHIYAVGDCVVYITIIRILGKTALIATCRSYMYHNCSYYLHMCVFHYSDVSMFKETINHLDELHFLLTVILLPIKRGNSFVETEHLKV